jgi:hypothetical protein
VFSGQPSGLGVIMCAVESMMIEAKAVMVSLLDDAAHIEPLAVLSGFRGAFYD